MTLHDPAAFRPTPVFRARRRRALARVRIEDARGASQEAMVEDFSVSGIAATARRAPPQPGELVTIELPDGQVLWGLVRWSEGRRFGVEFGESGAGAGLALPPD